MSEYYSVCCDTVCVSRCTVAGGSGCGVLEV